MFRASESERRDRLSKVKEKAVAESSSGFHILTHWNKHTELMVRSTPQSSRTQTDLLLTHTDRQTALQTDRFTNR